MNYLYIIQIILALNIWKGDIQDTKEIKIQRYTPTAQALAHRISSVEELAAMLEIAESESHFASYVLEGRCLEGPVGERCDPDKNGVPRATGPWQIWFKYCKGALRYAEGSPERIDATAGCALGRLRFGLRACPDLGWAGAISFYKTGYCEWSGVGPHIERMRRIVNKIQGKK